MPIDNAEARLARVAQQTSFTVPKDAQQLESWSNDVWRCGDVIVRVCHAGDCDRLIREAHIGSALPAEARYPRVLEFGRDEELAWMFVARLEGKPIHHDWRAMPHGALRPIVEELVGVLRVLHAWEPPVRVRALLQQHADDEPAADADAVIGHDILPLPGPRWRALVDAANAVPFIDHGVVSAAAQRLADLARHDPFADPGERIVHCDVNYSNLLVHEGELVALLDYEWARFGPPDAELVQLLRSSRRWGDDEPLPPVAAWFQELYPEMFSAPDLRERKWIAELAYMLRQLVLWPPRGAGGEAPSHPVNVLPRLVEAPWEYES